MENNADKLGYIKDEIYYGKYDGISILVKYVGDNQFEQFGTSEKIDFEEFEYLPNKVDLIIKSDPTI